jgi:hypothetical protein
MCLKRKIYTTRVMRRNGWFERDGSMIGIQNGELVAAPITVAGFQGNRYRVCDMSEIYEIERGCFNSDMEYGELLATARLYRQVV